MDEAGARSAREEAAASSLKAEFVVAGGRLDDAAADISGDPRKISGGVSGVRRSSFKPSSPPPPSKLRRW